MVIGGGGAGNSSIYFIGLEERSSMGKYVIYMYSKRFFMILTGLTGLY
jgi:hypothetical protein